MQKKTLYLKGKQAQSSLLMQRQAEQAKSEYGVRRTTGQQRPVPHEPQGLQPRMPTDGEAESSGKASQAEANWQTGLVALLTAGRGLSSSAVGAAEPAAEAPPNVAPRGEGSHHVRAVSTDQPTVALVYSDDGSADSPSG